jgi:CheY-like chemotaxis protein
MIGVPWKPVLILEDSDEDFETAREAAGKAGLRNEFRRATTGDDCLTMLRGGGAEAVRPAVVILDLNTPGTDGREALREIKADPQLRHLPVVVLTTSANPKDLAFCYQAGANAYHVKPIRHSDHIQILLEVFAYWIGRVVLPAAEGDSS